MVPIETTTIRVSTRTRDALNALAARRGEPAGEVVAKLVSAADDEALLVDAAAAFERLGQDPAYRSEVAEIEAGFDDPAPGW